MGRRERMTVQRLTRVRVAGLRPLEEVGLSLSPTRCSSGRTAQGSPPAGRTADAAVDAHRVPSLLRRRARRRVDATARRLGRDPRAHDRGGLVPRALSAIRGLALCAVVIGREGARRSTTSRSRSPSSSASAQKPRLPPSRTRSDTVDTWRDSNATAVSERLASSSPQDARPASRVTRRRRALGRTTAWW